MRLFRQLTLFGVSWFPSSLIMPSVCTGAAALVSSARRLHAADGRRRQRALDGSGRNYERSHFNEPKTCDFWDAFNAKEMDFVLSFSLLSLPPISRFSEIRKTTRLVDTTYRIIYRLSVTYNNSYQPTKAFFGPSLYFDLLIFDIWALE